MSNVRDLQPARPEPPEGSGNYMPRAPWKWILGLGTFVGLAIATYTVAETHQANEYRSEVLKAHRLKLAPVVTKYESLIGRINSWTVTAAQEDAPEPYADARLNLDALHKGRGLYLRIPADEARTPQGVVAASQTMGPDAITRCLGLTPVSARGLYAHGSFLTAEWIQQAQDTDNVMKLRVMAEEIRQRSERDLPGVRTALDTDWFLLVLERGENRRDAPVDVYLWNLESNKLLLRDRVQAEGALISARIAVTGTTPGHYASGAQSGAAQDCSIASQIRALTGRKEATFVANPPQPEQAYRAPCKPGTEGCEAPPAQQAPAAKQP